MSRRDLAPPAQTARPARHVYLNGVRRSSCRGAPWGARDRRVLALWRARNTGEGGRMGAQGYSCEPETPPSTTGIHLTHPLNDDEVVRTPNARNPACWSWHSARRCTGSNSRAAGWCRQLPPKRPSRSANDVESSDIGVDRARRHGARRATRDSLAERQI